MIEIPSIKQVRYISFYNLEISVVDSPNPQKWSIEKRYNDFFKLNTDLIARNFRDLPFLPKKTWFPVRNQIDL
jgi:hypothetical protein